MCPFDPATSSGAPGSVTPFRSRACAPAPVRGRAGYQTGGTRSPRCISLATSAAPVVVRRPATAQLLLPATVVRGTLPGTSAAALPLRTSSTSAGGTAGAAVTVPSDTGAAGASQLVPAGYRKLRPHFQRAPH